MRLVPALEYEKLRQDSDSWNKIRLHKDGKFYHAYEWSAWLIKAFVCTEDFQKQRGDDKVLAVARYKTKDSEYAVLGFPLESLSKYVHDYKDANQTEEGDMIIEIDLPFDEKVTFDQLNSAFEDWKQSCPELETKKKKNLQITQQNAAILGRSGIFQILSQVLSYPVERTTPAQNIDFISQLKQQVAALL